MTRLLATRQPRRRVIAGLVGGLTAVLGVGRQRESEASICGAGGAPCGSNAECCSGICDPHLYRCLVQPTVCMGSPGQQTVAGAQTACACAAPSGPPSSVIVSGVPAPPSELHQPVRQTSRQPAIGGARPDPSCQTLPGQPSLPIVADLDASEAESGEQDQHEPHRFAGWNY